MNRLLLLIPLLLVIALLLVLGSGLGNDPTKLDSARIGKAFPAFSLQSLQNADKTFTEQDLKGDLFLLNVWATWCPSCKTEHPYLLKIAAENQVVVVGHNYKDDRVAAIKWLQQLGDPYRFTLFDPKGQLGFDLGVYGAPETYLIDAQGVVRYRHVGVVDEKVWKTELLPVIERLRAGKA